MKYITILILALFSIHNSYSQPTITNKTIPVVSDKYYFTECDTNGIKQGPSGANVVWDFSSLVKLNEPDSRYAYEIVDPSTGYNFEQFKEANFAYKSGDAYGYYKSSSNKLERLGTGFQEGYEVLSDYETYAIFPFTYGNTTTDAFKGTMNIKYEGIDATMKRGGTIKVEADAYGKLILPDGSFDNLLRLKFTQMVYDTITLNFPGAPPIFNITETITYHWQNDEFKFGLLSISFIKTTQIVMGSETVTYANNVVIQDAENSVSKLSPPSIVSPSNNSNVKFPLNIEWTPSQLTSIVNNFNDLNEDISYELQVSNDAGWSQGNINTFNAGISTTYTINEPIQGEVLYFRVKASLGEISSEWSEVVYANVSGGEGLPKPILKTPLDGAENVEFIDLLLSWEAEGTYIEIDVYNDESSFGHYGENTNQHLMDLMPETTYKWRVRQSDDNGNTSDWSDEWTFTTKVNDKEYDAPLLVNPPDEATNVDYTSIEFTWESDGDEIEIEIYNDDYLSSYVGPNEGKYVVTNLEANTTYKWRMRQYYGLLVSTWSEERTFTTSSVSSVHDLLEIRNLNITPNPSSNVCNISCITKFDDSFEVSIIDISGREILKINLGDYSANTELNSSLNLSGIPAGAYLIQLNGKFHNYYGKLVVD
ncbi:hypothetical protein MASR1M45_03400 [Candidatus Kapaibacterium sp.]